MPPVDLDDRQWDTAKNLSMFGRIAAIQTQILVNSYTYSDISRLITVHDVPDDDATEDEEGDDFERLTSKSDDPLSSLIIDSLWDLYSETKEGGNEITVDPTSSVASLFDKGREYRIPVVIVRFVGYLTF